MEIKGTAVRSILEFVKSKYSDKYDQWFSSLSPEARNVFNTVLSNGWYPVKDGVIEPTEQIAKLFYDGDVLKAAFESGQYSAEMALTGVYKVYVRFSSPSHVVDRGSRILPAYYNPIAIQQIERKDRFVKFEIKDCPDVNEIIEQRIAGWMQKALEVSGCKTFEVKVIESMHIKGRTIIDARWS